MTEPSVRNEDIGVGNLAIPSHAQQFDLLPIVSEALESQFHIGLADEFDLQAESALERKLTLRRSRGFRCRLQLLQLHPQGLPVRLAIALR